MSSSTEQLLPQWYRACDPARALASSGDARYVPFDAWPDGETGATLRLRGALPPTQALAHAIRMEDATSDRSTFLFAGFRGAGKTTELQRLGRDLSHDFAVLYVDAGAYAGMLAAKADIVEFALALLAAIGVRAEEEFGAKLFKKRTIWEAIGGFLDSEVTKVGGSIAGFSIDVALRGNQSFREQLVAAFRKRPEAMRDFVHQQIHIVAEAAGRPLVILVDGLEKPNVQLDNIAAVYRYMAQLYTMHADWLKLPRAHTVYCVPPLVPVLSPGVESSFSGSVMALPSVKLHTRPPGRVEVDAAVRALCEVLVRRGVDLDALFGEACAEATRELVIRSGGHVRHLLEDTRALLIVASERGLPLAAATVVEVLDAQHGKFNISTTALGRLLAQIDDGRSLTQLDDEEISALAWALDQYLVLTYASGETWYDVHPRARTLLRAARESAAAIAESGGKA